MVIFFIENITCSFLFKTKMFLSGAKMGKGIKALGGGCPQVRINRNAKLVKIGNQVIFNNYNDAAWNSKCAIWVKEGASLVIGDNSGLNGALIYASTKVSIGNYVKIGGGCKIMDTDFHSLDARNRRENDTETKSAGIDIGDDVFIGSSSIILKGVSIGNRSIVAAGSIVTKSIPPDELWGGNPAKLIRKLS